MNNDIKQFNIIKDMYNKKIEYKLPKNSKRINKILKEIFTEIELLSDKEFNEFLENQKTVKMIKMNNKG